MASALPDGRAWEMVSPVDKNGGRIAAPGEIAGGGVLQAAADGGSVTYGSATSFGADPQGAPPGSQYLSARSVDGWTAANLSVPLFSASYGSEPDGVPYQLFSEDLARGLLRNGRRCRGEESGCAVANPPLADTDAPAGYQNYYLRQTAGPSFEALVGSGDVAETDLEPAAFELRFAGASADLRQVLLSTCAALTADATEAPLGEGCDPDHPNLYRWSATDGLRLVNPAPGAAAAAQATAVSSDGSRVYWHDLASGNLYLREGAQVKQVDVAAGGGGSFELATPSGAVAFFTAAGHLWRYDTVSGSATDLTPAGGVLGVLGASADASYLYYLSDAGLFVRHGAVTTEVAAEADPGNYPPTTGTARVSADGTRLLFLSSASLTGYNNLDQKSGQPDSEAFLYEASSDTLRCVTCRPSGARPIGPSSIPGSIPNGSGPDAPNLYKPRALSADGRRVFFDSRDALVPSDTNNDADVYQWEALGTGSCVKPAGCIDLISSGRSEDGARFVDASAGGGDAFFLTDGSLVGRDPGSVDLYDARIGGGFPEPLEPIPCTGDSCQSLPPEPVDPALSTLFAGPGNPPVRYRKYRRPQKKCHRASTKQGSQRAGKRKCGRKKPGKKAGSR
jgi:hypothetical protein